VGGSSRPRRRCSSLIALRSIRLSRHRVRPCVVCGGHPARCHRHRHKSQVAMCVRAMRARWVQNNNNIAPYCLSACCPMLPAKYEYETKAKAGSSRDQQGHLAIIANKPTHGALPSYIIHHTQPAALRPRTVEDPTTPNHTTLHHVNKCKWAVWAVCCMLRRMPGARLGAGSTARSSQRAARSTQHAARCSAARLRRSTRAHKYGTWDDMGGNGLYMGCRLPCNINSHTSHL
jgi:hypothetical protein